MASRTAAIFPFIAIFIDGKEQEHTVAVIGQTQTDDGAAFIYMDSAGKFAQAHVSWFTYERELVGSLESYSRYLKHLKNG